MIKQDRAEKLILLFVVLDFILMARAFLNLHHTLPPFVEALVNPSETGFILPFITHGGRLLGFLLLPIVAYGFLFEKRCSFLLYYLQFPLRIIFGFLSFGFISLLGEFLESLPLYKALFYFAMALEFGRLALTVMVQKTITSAWEENARAKGIPKSSMPPANRVKGTASLLVTIATGIKRLMTDKEFSIGVFSRDTLKSYSLQVLLSFILGILPCLGILWLVALDGGSSNLRMNWERFWTVLPYMAVALGVWAMCVVQGEKERKLSAIIFLSSVIVLIPLDIALNGIDTALDFAGKGFVFGVIASALYFSVITIQYSSNGTQSISDNFDKASFLGAFILCLFTAFIGLYGHAVINLVKLLS